SQRTACRCYSQCRQKIGGLLQRLSRPQTCFFIPTSAEMSECDSCPHYGTLGIERTQAQSVLFMVNRQFRFAIPHSHPTAEEPRCRWVGTQVSTSTDRGTPNSRPAAKTDNPNPAGAQRERIILAQSHSLSRQTFSFRTVFRSISETFRQPTDVTPRCHTVGR